jgi:hypothetical protein
MSWQTPKTDWQSSDNPGPGDFNRIEGNIAMSPPRGRQLFTESGTFIVQPGVTKVWVTACSGGQGGQGNWSETVGDETVWHSGSNGGDGYAVWNNAITVQSDEEIPITIGGGGAGGNNGATAAGPNGTYGSYGGETKFGNYLTCYGTGINGMRIWGYGVGGTGSPGSATPAGNGSGGACLVEW